LSRLSQRDPVDTKNVGVNEITHKNQAVRSRG
jgi:hypothetical protein